MAKFVILLTTLTTMLFSINAIAQKKQQKFKKIDISMYPKPKQDYKQITIKLPIIKNEENLKIELFIGTEKMVDCNNHTLVGNVTEDVVDGWGYNYFMVESTGETIGTKMACIKPATKKFVSMQPVLTRYNSKLPIALYVPQKIQVKYRIWRADTVMKKAK